MEEVKVKVIEEFKDRTEDLKLRKKDEVLTVSEERAKKLAGLGLVEFVENEPEPPAGEEPPVDAEEKSKKRSTKK